MGVPFFPILFPSIHARRKEDYKAPVGYGGVVDDDTTVIQGHKFSNQLIKFNPEVVEWILKTVSKSHPIA